MTAPSKQNTFFGWSNSLAWQYDEAGLDQLSSSFDLSASQENLVRATINTLPLNPYTADQLLSLFGIKLTEGLVGALLFNLATETNMKIDLDELLVDAVALERFLMYNNCRENSERSCVQRASQALTAKTLQHVMQHSKTLNTISSVQKRYSKTLIKIPAILQQYISAVKNERPVVKKPSEKDLKPISPFLLAPIYPKDYPPVGERNQDAFEIESREKRRKKLRLRWTQIAEPCQLKDKHLNTMAHSNNLHVWSLNERRKDLVQLPRLTLMELSKHPDNLTIEDVTELREKMNFLKINYYQSYLNATEMGSEEHWTELLGHEITSPVLKQVTRASFMTYSNPKYKLSFSPWEPKPFWMLRRNPTQGKTCESQNHGQWRS